MCLPVLAVLSVLSEAELSKGQPQFTLAKQ